MERMVFMHNRLTLGYMTDKALKSVSHEDANALTHINLAFGVIRDGLLDMSRLPNIREIDRIRDYNATLKIVLSIGSSGYCHQGIVHRNQLSLPVGMTA